MRDLDTLYIKEMNYQELSEFRRLWIKGYIEEMVVECSMNREIAECIADHRFEDYIGQEGHTARDERIADSR